MYIERVCEIMKKRFLSLFMAVFCGAFLMAGAIPTNVYATEMPEQENAAEGTTVSNGEGTADSETTSEPEEVSPEGNETDAEVNGAGEGTEQKDEAGNPEDTDSATGSGETKEETEEVTQEETETPSDRAAAYTGISLDGSVTDWDSVAKTTVADGSVQDVAMVFDGNDIFIYISEPADSSWDVARCAGVTHDGKFVITSDTGKQSVFYLRSDRIIDRNGNIIEGASVVYNNKQYEIRLPESMVKEYNETISLGYYEGSELITGVANLQGTSDSKVDPNSGGSIGTGIESGSGFANWAGYPHSTIAYSTIDAEGSAALYSTGDTLYIHELTSSAVDKDENASHLTPFTIAVNGAPDNWQNLVFVKLITVDANGNTTNGAENDLSSLTPGQYTFYVADNTVAWGYDGWNINNSLNPWETETSHTIYGKATVLVTETGYEMECSIDMDKLAKVYSVKNNSAFSANDLKTIQVQFGDIGNQWVSCAGTSTGPVEGGIIATLIAGFAAYKYYRKKEKYVPEAEAV